MVCSLVGGLIRLAIVVLTGKLVGLFVQFVLTLGVIT